MANTNKLERDIKETRKQLSASLDELRRTPRFSRALRSQSEGRPEWPSSLREACATRWPL
jgi:hypothetical protein